MAKKLISNLDIDSALGDIERVNKGVVFLAAALPEYPHDDGLDGVSVILECLSDRTQKNIGEIRAVAEL